MFIMAAAEKGGLPAPRWFQHRLRGGLIAWSASDAASRSDRRGPQGPAGQASWPSCKPLANPASLDRIRFGVGC